MLVNDAVFDDPRYPLQRPGRFLLEELDPPRSQQWRAMECQERLGEHGEIGSDSHDRLAGVLQHEADRSRTAPRLRCKSVAVCQPLAATKATSTITQIALPQGPRR